MNYLAHFHLAGNEPAMISGALLGDFVKGPLRGTYSSELERGIRLHRRIDAFSDTDSKLSHFRHQLPKHLQRYSSIITDVVFDFHLSQNWLLFHQQGLRGFANGIYAVMEGWQADFPPSAQSFGRQMVKHDLLCQYSHWVTIDRVLKSIAQRLPGDNPLHQGNAVIDAHQGLLQQAFFDFYPRVIEMTQQYQQ